MARSGGSVPVTPTERRQRITAVFDLARKLAPEDQGRFLERECRGDDDLLEEIGQCSQAYILSMPDKLRDRVYFRMSVAITRLIAVIEGEELNLGETLTVLDSFQDTVKRTVLHRARISEPKGRVQ